MLAWGGSFQSRHLGGSAWVMGESASEVPGHLQ
jgi:hypothetical protein